MRAPLLLLSMLSLAGLTFAACGGTTAGVASGDGGSPGSDSGPGPGCGDFAPCGRTPAKHRAAATACDDVRNAPDPIGAPDSGFPGSCTKHADCTAGRNGRCTQSRAGYMCSYDACLTDSECKGFVCNCGEGDVAPNTCMAQGNCRVDSDCGANGFCSPSFGSCGTYSGVLSYYCHTAKDECVDDSDCTEGGRGFCMYEPTASHWKCAYTVCLG